MRAVVALEADLQEERAAAKAAAGMVAARAVMERSVAGLLAARRRPESVA